MDTAPGTEHTDSLKKRTSLELAGMEVEIVGTAEV